MSATNQAVTWRQQRLFHVAGTPWQPAGASLYWLYRRLGKCSSPAGFGTGQLSSGRARLGQSVVKTCMSGLEGMNSLPVAGTSWRPAGASLYWLQEALRALDADLRARFGAGAGILFRRGPYLPALRQAVAELGAGSVYMGRRFGPSMSLLQMSVYPAGKRTVTRV